MHVTAYAPLGRGAVLAAEGGGKRTPGTALPTAARGGGGGGGGGTAANSAAPCCLLEEEPVVAAAARLGCTPAQVLLLGAAAWRLTPTSSQAPAQARAEA